MTMTDEEFRKALEKLGGAAKVVNLNCPSCGSTNVVETGGRHYHCQSCDTNFTLDNGPRVVINGNIVFQEGHEASSKDAKTGNHQPTTVRFRIAHSENEAKRIALDNICQNPNLPEDFLEKMTFTNICLFYIKIFGISPDYFCTTGNYDIFCIDNFGIAWNDRMEKLPQIKGTDRYLVSNHEQIGEMPVYDITCRYEEKDYHLFVYAGECELTVLYKEFPVNQKTKGLRTKKEVAKETRDSYAAGITVSTILLVGMLIGGLIMIATNITSAGIVLLSLCALFAILLVLFVCLTVRANKDYAARVSEIKAYQKEKEERCRKIYEEKIKELGGNL